MVMISKLRLLARALLLSSLGLCASRSSLGLAALQSPAPGVFRFSVRFLRVALGEATRYLHRQTALQLPAPAWHGLRSGCDSPWLLGERGAPLACRAREAAPSGTEGRRGTAPSQRKRAAGYRAQTARSRRTPPRATWRAISACARGAPPARSPAREPARPRGVQPARPRGVQQARPSGVQAAPSGAPRRVQERATVS